MTTTPRNATRASPHAQVCHCRPNSKNDITGDRLRTHLRRQSRQWSTATSIRRTELGHARLALLELGGDEHRGEAHKLQAGARDPLRGEHPVEVADAEVGRRRAEAVVLAHADQPAHQVRPVPEVPHLLAQLSRGAELARPHRRHLRPQQAGGVVHARRSVRPRAHVRPQRPRVLLLHQHHRGRLLLRGRRFHQPLQVLLLRQQVRRRRGSVGMALLDAKVVELVTAAQLHRSLLAPRSLVRLPCSERQGSRCRGMGALLQLRGAPGARPSVHPW
eukprot:scaffold1630_cov298-Prasinococcus_capsulatus_cf.AAC.11